MECCRSDSRGDDEGGGWLVARGEVDGDVEVKGSMVEWYYLKRGEGVGL